MVIRFKNGGGFSIGLIGMIIASGIVYDICKTITSCCVGKKK